MSSGAPTLTDAVRSGALTFSDAMRSGALTLTDAMRRSPNSHRRNAKQSLNEKRNRNSH